MAAAVAASLLLAGCGPTPAQTFEPNVDASIAAELKPFYNQTVDWKPCGGDDTFCGTVLVPADWSKPKGKKFKLAVGYHQASVAKPLGSIIFNPGGPGSSGLDWVANSADQIGTKELRSNFNIVGFDPRGVGQSDPKVSCLNAKAMDNFLYSDSGFEVDTAEEIVDTRAKLSKFIDGCVANTGFGLGLIDTVSAAKDLDVLRAVFGEQQISYLGFSYGTLLGATYATLFPQRVGRMVLDGAIDPTMSDAEQNLGQLQGFDLALRNYLVDCLDSADCPFEGSLALAENKIASFMRSLETDPLTTESGRELTVWAALAGIIMPLYSSDWWPTLSQAFDLAFDGDGTILLGLADVYNDRNENGTYASNITEANIAISCLDSQPPADNKSMAEQNEILLATGSVFARYWLNGALGCEQWPFAVATAPSSYAATGSNPIVVVGTKGDPATPYGQAVSLARQVLENGYLITFNGEGHTAYGGSSACVNGAVDAYFIEGRVPLTDPDC